ncbi:hypothetical protein FQR65_LT20399 [Abscondita terminalis]|nr:hypothetical protein FQR65_LT20399 [Abscondita terminalis]
MLSGLGLPHSQSALGAEWPGPRYPGGCCAATARTRRSGASARVAYKSLQQTLHAPQGRPSHALRSAASKSKPAHRWLWALLRHIAQKMSARRVWYSTAPRCVDRCAVHCRRGGMVLAASSARAWAVQRGMMGKVRQQVAVCCDARVAATTIHLRHVHVIQHRIVSPSTSRQRMACKPLTAVSTSKPRPATRKSVATFQVQGVLSSTTSTRLPFEHCGHRCEHAAAPGPKVLKYLGCVPAAHQHVLHTMSTSPTRSPLDGGCPATPVNAPSFMIGVRGCRSEHQHGGQCSCRALQADAAGGLDHRPSAASASHQHQVVSARPLAAPLTRSWPAPVEPTSHTVKLPCKAGDHAAQALARAGIVVHHQPRGSHAATASFSPCRARAFQAPRCLQMVKQTQSPCPIALPSCCPPPDEMHEQAPKLPWLRPIAGVAHAELQQMAATAHAACRTRADNTTSAHVGELIALPPD